MDCLGVIVLMEDVLGACGCWSCVGVSLQGAGRGLGFVGAFITWKVDPQLKFGGDGACRMGVLGTPSFCWIHCHVGELGVGLVSVGLLLCSFVGMMAFRAFCWWGSSIVLYGDFVLECMLALSTVLVF